MSIFSFIERRGRVTCLVEIEGEITSGVAVDETQKILFAQCPAFGPLFAGPAIVM